MGDGPIISTPPPLTSQAGNNWQRSSIPASHRMRHPQLGQPPTAKSTKFMDACPAASPPPCIVQCREREMARRQPKGEIQQRRPISRQPRTASTGPCCWLCVCCAVLSSVISETAGASHGWGTTWGQEQGGGGRRGGEGWMDDGQNCGLHSAAAPELFSAFLGSTRGSVSRAWLFRCDRDRLNREPCSPAPHSTLPPTLSHSPSFRAELAEEARARRVQRFDSMRGEHCTEYISAWARNPHCRWSLRHTHPHPSTFWCEVSHAPPPFRIGVWVAA